MRLPSLSKLLITLALGLVMANEGPAGELPPFTPAQLASMPPGDVHSYLRQAVEAKLPPHSVDAIIILASLREKQVVAEIVAQFRASLIDGRPSDDVRNRLGSILAHLGTPASLDGLVSVLDDSPEFVGLMVETALVHSVARGRAIELVYHLVEQGPLRASALATSWVEVNSSRWNLLDDLARAMLTKNNGRTVSDTTLAADPIASKLRQRTWVPLREKLDALYVLQK